MLLKHFNWSQSKCKQACNKVRYAGKKLLCSYKQIITLNHYFNLVATGLSVSSQLGALQEVLEKLQAKRLPSWEKKFGQVPTVDGKHEFEGWWMLSFSNYLTDLIKHIVRLCPPQCDVGEQCAVRKGARIGKMCDCPRGAFCNFFLLKCLWAYPDQNVALRREQKNEDQFLCNYAGFYLFIAQLRHITKNCRRFIIS